MTLVSFARRLATDGQLSRVDAQKVIAEATRTGAPDAVAALLADPQLRDLMAPAAHVALEGFVSTHASTKPRGQLPDGSAIFLREGQFVSSPDAALPTAPKAFGEQLYLAARVFAEPGADVVSSLSTAERKAVAERTIVGLAQCRPGALMGYDGPTQAAQQRSASATVLRALLEASADAGPEGVLLQDTLVTALTQLIQQETVPGLQDHMAFHLHALKDSLSDPAHVAAVDKAFEAFAPESPPYDEWFKDGNRDLNVTCHTGGEFFDSEVKRWVGEGFSIVEEGTYGKPTILERTMSGADGDITVQLKMHRGKSGTFDAMSDDDSHIVAYSGHSGWGKNMPGELKGAPDSVGEKLMLIHQCCGQGIMNTIRDKYPDSQLVTTRYSSTEPDDFFAFKTVLEGIAQRSTWDEIHDEVAHGHSFRNREDNYITPADEYTRMKSLDRDNDGRADLLDRLYDFNSFDVAVDTAAGFSPKPPSARNQVLAGERVHNAVQFINVTAGWSHFIEQHERPLKFVNDGYFKPSDSADKTIFRVSEETISLTDLNVSADRAALRGDNQTIVKFALNENFAHASEEALKAAALVMTGIGYGDGANPSERLLQGLILAVHGMTTDAEYGRERLIFDELVVTMGLPASLTYDDARTALKADSHVYAGNDKGLQQWMRKLGPAVMDELASALPS